jgi:uncharacterized protein (TIGR02246 family)
VKIGDVIVTVQSPEEIEVRELYQQLLNAWNRRDAKAFAALYEENGNQIGFDGSQVDGKVEIESSMSRIFADHVTSAYISIVREVRFLNGETAILRAVAGMLPPGQNDINPAVNSIQTLVAVKQTSSWKIALFHNTPAAFHGRPQAVEQLTAELRQLLPAQK